jgi:membrane protease YdiL (CAAX protease family)
MTENTTQYQPWPAGEYSSLPPEKPRLGTWDFGRALIFYMFLVGATIVVGVTLLLLFGFQVSALLTELALYLVLPYLLSRFMDTGWSDWIRRPRMSIGAWVAMLLALLGLGVLISNIPVAVDLLYPMSKEYKEFFETFLRAESVDEFALLFLIAAVVPGICEEIVFRGLIHHGIRATYGSRVAVVVTSILFALIHLSIWNFGALIFMGAFLSILREKTGSIWPGAVAHTVNNTLALTLITVAPPAENSWQYDFFPLWINVVALAVFLGGMFLFRQQKKEAVSASTSFEQDW